MARTPAIVLSLGLAGTALAIWYFRTRPGAATPSAGASTLAESTLTEFKVMAEKIGLSRVPAGIRNNNPGNLRYLTGAHAWDGQIGNAGGYGVYRSPDRGVRALGQQLQVYERRGLRTVRAIVGVWAPPSENNTAAYIADVARKLGVQPDDPISVTNRLPELAAAIIQHENGEQPYALSDIKQWVYAA